MHYGNLRCIFNKSVTKIFIFRCMISHIFLIFFKAGNEFKINGPETNYGIAIPK